MADDVQDVLDGLREQVVAATANLHEAVAEACPGRHGPVQHRDGLPPWCPYCGRTSDGTLAGGHRRADVP